MEPGDYNCLIGLSGGRDSSYLAFRTVNDWNLRPLGYCYDNGHMPETTRLNVELVSQKMGIETLIFDNERERNRSLFKNVFLGWMKRPHVGMLQAFCIGCRGGMNKYIPRITNKYKIRYVIDGANNYEDGTYKLNIFGIDKNDYAAFDGKYHPLHLKLAWAISKEVIKNPAYLNPVNIFYGLDDFLKGFGAGTCKISPFMYEKYNEPEVMDIIMNNFNWKKPCYFPSYWRSDCDLLLIKNYFCYKMMGFSDHDVFLSNMIRDNAIDRESAIERIHKINFMFDRSTSKVIELLRSYNINLNEIKFFFDI